MPLPCIRKGTANRCEGKSKRTGLPCQNPSAFGCKTCRMHGAHRKKVATGDNHWNLQHGRSTKKKRAESSALSMKLLILRDLGVFGGLFGEKLPKLRGRPPKGYRRDFALEDLLAKITELDKC